MQSYLEKLGSNPLVAALIPSFAFVATAMVIFEPIMPPGLTDRWMSIFNPFGQLSQQTQQGVLLLALTTILGFTLSNLNIAIYRLLEGYHLLARLPGARWFQRRKAQRIKDQLATVESQLRALENEGADADDTHLQELKDEHYYISSELELRFPREERAILPTMFGNIFRAAEYYPATRYGIDAMRLWPRLVHVMPTEYYDKIKQSNNKLAFVVNCAVLSLFMAILSVLAAAYEYLVYRYALLGKKEILHFVPVEPQLADVYFQRVFIYLTICALALVISWLMYRASFPIAMQYGNMIRISFDLFRFDLLRQLKLEQPEDSESEYDLWKKVSEFIATGLCQPPFCFEYQHAAKKNAGSGLWSTEEASARSHLSQQPQPGGLNPGQESFMAQRSTRFQELKRSFSQYTLVRSGLAAIERALDKLSGAKPGDVQRVAASQIELLSGYYKLVLGQAHRSFRWALIAACLGLALLVASISFLLMQQSRDIAIVGLISGALVEVISGINFYLFDRCSSQLADFHARLDLTQRFLLANSICEGIDGDLRKQTRSYLVLAIAGTNATLTPQQTSAPLQASVLSQAIAQSQPDVQPLPASDVHITHIEYSPPGDHLEGEYVRLKNSGGAAADMTDWTLRDEAGHEFTFPAFTLRPGAYVRVWAKAGTNTSTDLYWGRKQAVWNNRGDCAYLRDGAGTVIDEYCYSAPATED